MASYLLVVWKIFQRFGNEFNPKLIIFELQIPTFMHWRTHVSLIFAVF